MSKENSKILHEFYEYINKVDLINSDYEIKIKTRTKKLIDDLYRFDRENIFYYVQAQAVSSLIFRENDILCADEMFIKKNMALEYFLILALDKYGMGSALEKLLPQSIIHEKHSKLNPINWLLWIFNKIVWSEVKVRSEFSSDQLFVDAIQNLKKMSDSADFFARKNLFNDKDLHKAVKVIIERIADVTAKEEVSQEAEESGCLIDFSQQAMATVLPEGVQSQKSSMNSSDISSEGLKDLDGLIFPKSSKRNTWQELPPPPPPPLFYFSDSFLQSSEDDSMPLPPPPSPLTEDNASFSFPPASSSLVPPEASELGRAGLAESIRKGITLKKLGPESKPNFKNTGNDVASILLRRPALAFSDSESDGEDSDFEEQAWESGSEKQEKQGRSSAACEQTLLFRKASSRGSLGGGDVSTNSAAPLHYR